MLQPSSRWCICIDDPRRSFNVNAFLRLFGLRTNAARADRVLYWAVSVVLLADGVGVAVATWSSSRTFVFNALNECIDPRAELPQLGEQAYRPSQQYLDCIQGPHRTAFLLGVVAASAVLLLVFAGLTVLA